MTQPEQAPRNSGKPEGESEDSEGSEDSEEDLESSTALKAGEKNSACKVDQASSTPKAARASLTSKVAEAAKGGALALNKSARPNKSSELSSEEEDVEAPKSGGDEMEVDEETEVGALNKGAGDAARGGKTVEPASPALQPTDCNAEQSARSSAGTTNAPTKELPAPESSSALADVTGPIVQEKGVEVEAQPMAKEKKEKKGRKKKADKGKEKDPGETGSSGVKTRSALKSAS